MIQANELRIGNYCYCQDDINLIYGITKEGFIQYEKDNNVYYCGIDELKPIKLTEEILLKCGFEKGLKYFSYKDFDVDLKGWFGFNNMVANANIKHIHQLQNLYFALTGEELEINL